MVEAAGIEPGVRFVELVPKTRTQAQRQQIEGEEA